MAERIVAASDHAGPPSSSVIFCVALKVEKQYCGLPFRQLRQLPHTARQLRIT